MPTVFGACLSFPFSSVKVQAVRSARALTIRCCNFAAALQAPLPLLPQELPAPQVQRLPAEPMEVEGELEAPPAAAPTIATSIPLRAAVLAPVVVPPANQAAAIPELQFALRPAAAAAKLAVPNPTATILQLAAKPMAHQQPMQRQPAVAKPVAAAAPKFNLLGGSRGLNSLLSKPGMLAGGGALKAASSQLGQPALSTAAAAAPGGRSKPAPCSDAATDAKPAASAGGSIRFEPAMSAGPVAKPHTTTEQPPAAATKPQAPPVPMQQPMNVLRQPALAAVQRVHTPGLGLPKHMQATVQKVGRHSCLSCSCAPDEPLPGQAQAA